MNDRIASTNYTILPLSDDLVKAHPARVKQVLTHETRMRTPVVVASSADVLKDLMDEFVLVDVRNVSDRYDPSEVCDMTSEEAFHLAVDQIGDSNLRSLLESDSKTPVLGRLSGIHGHTFGFDGIDAHAGILAAALTRIGASSDHIRVKVFGELPGVFSADPSIVEPGYTPEMRDGFQHVRRQKRMSFREALELSTLNGPRAFTSGGLMGLDQRGIQLQVRSIYDFRDKGTRVSEQIESKGVQFISGKNNQILYTVSSARMAHSSGIASLVLKACEELDISVTATFGGGSSFPFTIDADHPQKEELESRLDRIGTVMSQPGVALVSCIGNGMKQQRGLSRNIAGVLDRAGINVEEITTSADRNYTLVVQEADYELAIVALHRELIEGEEVGR